jgi:hypothetical protein
VTLFSELQQKKSVDILFIITEMLRKLFNFFTKRNSWMSTGSDMDTIEVALLEIPRADVSCPSYCGGVMGRSGRETSKNMREFF